MSKVKAQAKPASKEKEKPKKDSSLDALLTRIHAEGFSIRETEDQIDIYTTKNAWLKYEEIIKPLKQLGYIVTDVENRWRTTHVLFAAEAKMK